MTLAEAELLIALLAGAEESFAETRPLLIAALEDLRPLRSALLQAYLRARLAVPPSVDAAPF